MTDQLRDLVMRSRDPRSLWRAWRDDRRGATLIQFVAVLPVLILIIVGLFSLFQVYSAHQSLCEAVWMAGRYLQTEGPWFDEGVDYPNGWIPVATQIINSELKSNAMVDMQVEADSVSLYPPARRVPPQDVVDVSTESLRDTWFMIRASVDIANPLAIFMDTEGDAGTLRLTCQKTSYYETAPLRSTDLHRPKPELCPKPPPDCTPGLPPTPCSGPPGHCPTPDPCPCKPN